MNFRPADGVALIGVYIPTASVEGAENTGVASDFRSLAGNGAYAIVSVGEEESSEAPTPGDSGVLLFAILGVVAVAGAAVAIKARG